MHESKADTSLESNVQPPRVETLDTQSELELDSGIGDLWLDVGPGTLDCGLYFTIVPVRRQRVLVKKSRGLAKGCVSSYDQ